MDELHIRALLSRLAQLEELLHDGDPIGRIQRANMLALSIARFAPPHIASLARRVIVATEAMKDDAPMEEHPPVREALLALRDALRIELGPSSARGGDSTTGRRDE